MRKKILVTIPIVFILVILVFWQSIVSSFLNICLDSYCSHQLNATFKNAKIYKDNSNWVIEEPLLTKKGLTIQASRINIEPQFKLLNGQLDLAIHIVQPELHFDEANSDPKEIFAGFLPHANTTSFGPFTVNTNVAVIDGAVFCVKDQCKKCLACFSTDANWTAEEQRAKIAINLDHENVESNVFNVLLNKAENDKPYVELVFQQVECRKLGSFLEGMGCTFKGWRITDGILHGTLATTVDETSDILSLGELNIENLRFEHPKMKIQGAVKKSRIIFEKSAEQVIAGAIELQDDASIVIYRGNIPFWEIKNLVGGITFNEAKNIHLSLTGDCQQEQNFFNLIVNGDACLAKHSPSCFNVAFNLKNPHSKGASFNIHGIPLENHYTCLEVACKNISKHEFAFIQTAVGKYFPDWDEIHMHEGFIDASCTAFLQKLKIADVKIDNILASNLKFDLGPGDFSVSTEKTSGTLSINLAASNIIDTINSDISIMDGQIQFRGMDGNLWKLQDIHTDLAIRNGVIQKSEMQGVFAGLNGIIDVDWLSPDDTAKLQFSGDASGIIKMAPANVKSRLQAAFAGNNIHLTAGIKWKSSGVKVNGKVGISSNENDSNTIAFGFFLEKSSEKLWKQWPASPTASSYWQNVGLEAMQSLLPPIAAPTVLLESNWMKSESGIAGLVMRQGWFTADNIPLEKFINPCLFPNDQMKVSGIGNFKGIFDHSKLSVEYTGENIVLDNDDITLTVPYIRNREDKNTGRKLYAAHHFDFSKRLHFGSLPLESCTYLIKDKELVFKDLKAAIMFEGLKIHLSNVETTCNDIFFAGNIDVDFSIPDDGCYDVFVNNHLIKGKVSQVQKLLKQFSKDTTLLDIPLDGDIEYTDSAQMHFAFQPDDYQFQGICKGNISKGQLPLIKDGMILTDIYTNFFYNHKDSILEFSNLQGSLRLNGVDNPEEYHLGGEYIRFDNFDQDIVNFDLWLGDHTKDVVRLVGNTYAQTVNNKEHYIVFNINNELTHFGDIHPADFKLVLKNWSEVEVFETNFQIRLNTLYNDFQRFARAGLLSFSRNLAKNLDGIQTVSGDLAVAFNYLKDSTELAFEVNGNDLLFGDHICQQCRIIGKKKGSEWNIDDLQLDEVSARGTIEKNSKEWNVNQLQLKYRNAIFMVMNGSYLPKENVFQARLKNLEIDLAEITEWPNFQDFTKEYSPHGKMVASGELKIFLNKMESGWSADALLNANLMAWDFMGMRFSDTKKFSCHFISNKEITIRNLQTSLLPRNQNSAYADVHIEKVNFGFANKDLHVEGLHFDLPSQNLCWLADSLTTSCPTAFGPEIFDTLRHIKSNGKLTGSISFELNPPYNAVRVVLADGHYRFLDKEHELRNFVLDLNPFEFKVGTEYVWNNYPFSLLVRSTSPTFSQGDLTISDISPDQILQKNSLNLAWENDPTGGFTVRDIKGSILGLSMQLTRDVSEPLVPGTTCLIGKVIIDATKLQTFCPPEIAQKMKDWQIGRGCWLEGKWKSVRNPKHDLANQIYFSGTLKGKDFELKGFQFDNLSASVEYGSSTLSLNNFTIDDMAVLVSIPQINVSKATDSRWYFAFPSMSVKRFRPSLLRDQGMARPHVYKPLIITDIVLEGCQGCTEDYLTVSGKGFLNFTNRSKKLLHNTIFHVPAEILSRIGLDLSVLTPVSGTINYSIANGKFYFTKFKDIYSDGKLSKFYLPSGPSSSYMDFDGNLYVQVKMKQYNLLFKLAELFTFTVQGNIQKPVYTLQKQNKTEQFISR